MQDRLVNTKLQDNEPVLANHATLCSASMNLNRVTQNCIICFCGVNRYAVLAGIPEALYEW